LGALDRMGALDGRTVIVHGVSIDLGLMRSRGAGLVWCPSSNLGMLGRTVPRTVLRSGIRVALGTESGLSAAVDLLDELRVARRFIPAERLLEMVTSTPAELLRLKGLSRDWVAIRSRAATAGEALLDGQVAVVVRGGRLRLIDPELGQPRGFQELALEGRPTVLVDADMKGLRRAASRYLGSDFRLAGKRLL
jgi:cytosine/adenosine deaminase-related metal-dependent hydrolase